VDKAMIASYPRYDSYKETSEEWIGKIPTTWDSVPLRNIFKFRNEKNDPIITDEILSLSIAHGVTKYSDKNRGGNKRKDDITAYKIARPNDIVLNSMNIIVGAVGLSKYFGAISPVYYALYLHSNEASINYYEWVFHNESFQKSLLKYGKGILIKMGEGGKMNTIRMKISQHDMKYFILPCPPLSDQEKIAKFLESKTAQIDQAITLKQQQIAKLEEYKQIVIQNAVTKGLNPDAPMKDSGVDWIGDIPEHWEVKKLKRVAILNPKIRLNNLEYNELVSFLPMERVSVNGDVDYSLKRPLNEVKQGFTVFEKDDVILAKITPCFENGKGALLNKLDTPVGFGSTEFHVIRAKKDINKKYLYNITQSPIFLKVGEKMMIGSAGQKRVPTDFVSNYDVALPSLEEQCDINEFIDNISMKIRESIEVQRKQIERLKEYKTILINQAVTGKIKVS